MHTDVAVAAIIVGAPGLWETLLILAVAGAAGLYSLIGIMLTNEVNNAARVLYD